MYWNEISVVVLSISISVKANAYKAYVFINTLQRHLRYFRKFSMESIRKKYKRKLYLYQYL